MAAAAAPAAAAAAAGAAPGAAAPAGGSAAAPAGGGPAGAVRHPLRRTRADERAEVPTAHDQWFFSGALPRGAHRPTELQDRADDVRDRHPRDGGDVADRPTAGLFHGVQSGAARDVPPAGPGDRGRVGTRGVIVRKLDTDEIEEIYAFRMILEARAARLASERITQQSLQTLQQLHQDMREAFNEEDYASYYELNLKFHKEIHQAAHTPRLIEIIAMVMKESLLLHSRGLVDRENLQTSLAEHQNLLDALISRDSELAEIYMRRHIQSGLKRLHLDDESNESDELN